MPTGHAGQGETISLDTDKRVTRAEELLCEQYTSRQIVTLLCDEFKVVPRTAYSYLKLAYDNLATSSAEERGLRKAQAIAVWKAQFRRCIKKGDMSAANYAQDRLCRIYGLYAPLKHKVEMTGSISVGVQIRNVMNVLDARGLEAMAIVLEQLDAAKQKGLLVEDPIPTPALPAGDGDGLFDIDAPKPAEATKTRGRKPPRDDAS